MTNLPHLYPRYEDTIQVLLEAGADPTCADYRGMCALDFASTSAVLRRWKKARYGKKKVRAGEV